MIKKYFRLEEEIIEIIHEIMQTKNFTSENQAINFIIGDYQKLIEERKDYDKDFEKKFKPIIANLRKLEREIHTIKDVVNTTLFEFHDATHLLPADEEEGSYKHRILRESEERYDQNIAMLRKKKNKENNKEKDFE